METKYSSSVNICIVKQLWTHWVRDLFKTSTEIQIKSTIDHTFWMDQNKHFSRNFKFQKTENVRFEPMNCSSLKLVLFTNVHFLCQKHCNISFEHLKWFKLNCLEIRQFLRPQTCMFVKHPCFTGLRTSALHDFTIFWVPTSQWGPLGGWWKGGYFKYGRVGSVLGWGYV